MDRTDGQWLTEPRGDANVDVNANAANPEALVQPPAETDDDADDNDTGHNHMHGHGHSHGRHGHGHGEGDDAHVHLPRDEVEAAAVEKEGAPQPGERICAALRRLTVAHGILTAAEIREAVEKTETMNEQLVGPAIVAKAWSDPDFKVRLVATVDVTTVDTTVIVIIVVLLNCCCCCCCCWVYCATPHWWKVIFGVHDCFVTTSGGWGCAKKEKKSGDLPSSTRPGVLMSTSRARHARH